MVHMNADFLDAHHRHWEDAELLAASSRLANADQLYGVSAECGLKRLMVHLGMPIDSDGSPTRTSGDRGHIDHTWGRYGAYLSGPLATFYALPTTNPFADWNVSQRYAHQGNFDQSRIDRHRAGSETVRNLIKVAMQGGLI